MSNLDPKTWENLEFTDAERERRWREIRWRMDLAGLDVLLVWGNESKWRVAMANNRYICGRAAPGCILFPRKGDPVLWTGFPHDVTPWGALANGWIKDARAGQQNTTRELIREINERGYQNAHIGIVGFGENAPKVIPETVPYTQLHAVKAEFPKVTFTASGWLLEQVRMIKSAEEIAILQRAADLSRLMAEAMVEACRPGRREYEVYAMMQNASLANGGEEDMIWLSSGPRPAPHGRRAPAGARVLEKGDIIVSEFHASYKGYLGGAEVSVSIGEPAREYKEIYKCCVESQKAGINAMKPGRPFGDAVAGFRDVIEKRGFGTVECGLHGHGLASPEFPSCMYGGQAGSWPDHAYSRVPSLSFQENMCFATATDIFDPAFGKDTGLMLGRTVLITADGPVETTGLPLDGEIIAV